MAPLICTLGDLLLDVVVTGQGPVEKAADTYSQVTVCAGGQAANVAAWAAALGARARLVAKRVDDPAGRVLAAEMAARGVEVVGPEVAPGTCARTGVVVSLSGFDGERSMLTDRGASPALSADELQAGWFECCDWLHLPLYSLVDAPIRRSSARGSKARLPGEPRPLLGHSCPSIGERRGRTASRPRTARHSVRHQARSVDGRPVHGAYRGREAGPRWCPSQRPTVRSASRRSCRHHRSRGRFCCRLPGRWP